MHKSKDETGFKKWFKKLNFILKKCNRNLSKITSNYSYILILSIVFLAVLTPFIVAIGITNFPLVNLVSGTSNGWLGFWGSFLGGILGTIGVIYVAHLQNEKQIDNLKMVEADNKKRLQIETEIDLLKSYQSDINILENDISLYKEIVSKILNNLESKDAFKTTKSDKTNDKEIYQDRIDVLTRKIEYIESNHFSTLFNKIELMNIVLKESSYINLMPLPSGNEFEELDKIIDSLKDGIDINSFHKSFANFDLMEIGTDNYMKENVFEKLHSWLIIENGEIHKSLSNLLRNLR
ncbi:hypothetical protein [Salinicoccus halodurans]|uniref:Uncharacterized protein n=1 Tax=Salinicoccus halodurans TaxID=407035 RepID=A0A0F7HLZ5_9STAP|nr:hypothetical protein [Salinicoccus halodurans]AKG74412.1 hypothetical protein AAT16_09365 [Salinicoccus halodurans]SFK95670.1 hypothetical protein SAMN05216235_2770 [Salinicoccus halodurans]